MQHVASVALVEDAAGGLCKDVAQRAEYGGNCDIDFESFLTWFIRSTQPHTRRVTRSTLLPVLAGY